MLIDGKPVFEKQNNFNVVLALFQLPLSERRELIVEEFELMTMEEYCNMPEVERVTLALHLIKEFGKVDELITSVKERSERTRR